MTTTGHTTLPAPSPWVVTHAARITAGAKVLDVACGSGRHTRYLHAQGHPVVATDINLAGVADLHNTSGIVLLQADLENTAWPFGPGEFAGIVVTNYLHRPHFPLLVSSLAASGVLIYETFALGHEKYGSPRNPDYLLKAGELRQVFAGDLDILAFEQVESDSAVRQRICAQKL